MPNTLTATRKEHINKRKEVIKPQRSSRKQGFTPDNTNNPDCLYYSHPNGENCAEILTATKHPRNQYYFYYGQYEDEYLEIPIELVGRLQVRQ